ncbi:DUF2142 domain-containing protein [Aeromicrobium sp. CF4.19]|uniref:DUF2142 domain-containing protein n=1 Tax=Aeromicrobium sp. CF4.19 TaxID=3373082 RepID=UPI003EE771FD
MTDRRIDGVSAADCPAHPGFVRGVALLTLALFGVLTLWATLTPAFSTVDEPRHFNSVVRLVQGGGWPPPQTAPILEATAVAESESGGTDPAQRGHVPPQKRSAVLALDAPESATPRLDWMNQHPPTYYGLGAGVVMAIDALTPGEQRWDETVLAVRMLSVVFAAASLPFVARSLLLVTGSVPASLVGGAVFLVVPQLFNTHSLITNDAMITFLGSVLTYAGIRAFTRPKTLLSSSVLGGVALGVGLLTKGLMLPAVAVLAMFLLLAGRRAGRGWRSRFWIPLLGGAIAFAIGGWWWVRNIVVYGQIQSSNNDDPRAAEPFDGYSLTGFAVDALARLNRTFWASIRSQVGYDDWVVIMMSAVALLVVVTAIVLSRRRGILLLTAVYPALVAGLFTYNALRIYWNFGELAGIQGRYLYSGLTFFALALALVWQELTDRLGRAVGIILATVVMACTCITVVGSYVYAFRVQWGGQGATLAERYLAMVEASAVPVWLHALVISGTALAGLAAAVVVVRSAATRDPVVAPAG